MKITIIHNEMAPYRIPLFNRLGEKFDVNVIFGRKKEPKRLWKIPTGQNFKWKVLPAVRIGNNYVLNLPIGLFRTLKESDIILVADNVDIYPLVILSAIFAKLARKPLVVWVGRIDTEYIKKIKKRNFIIQYIDEILKRFLYKLGDSFIVYSSKSREFLLKRGIRPHKISHGTTQYYPEELLQDVNVSQFAGQKSYLTVLALGYLEKRKGFEYLIQAVCGINEIKLKLAGTGKYEKILKEKAKNCNNIQFLGYIDGKKKAIAYKEADIFVFPTLHDPWGFVVNEAFYYGLPVVITTSAGATDVVVHQKNGFIIKPKDYESIKKILIKLQENRKLLKKMKIRAKKTGRKLTNIQEGVRTVEQALLKAIELY